MRFYDEGAADDDRQGSDDEGGNCRGEHHAHALSDIAAFIHVRPRNLRKAEGPHAARRRKSPNRVRPRFRQPVNGRIRISTRRFWARPSAVAFEATGARDDMPSMNRRSRITP